jgi:hypothetical protein
LGDTTLDHHTDLTSPGRSPRWLYRWLLVLLVGVTVACLTVNLDTSPRPWHDEGAAVSLGMAVAVDGVYAGRHAGGYETFGAVQSVGPTVILPISLTFKALGVGLGQARLVAIAYALVLFVLVVKCAQRLGGPQAALMAGLLLLSSPTTRFLFFGRQINGEIPALAFVVAGWFAWVRPNARGRWSPSLLTGLLFGLAVVTKSHFAVYVFGSLAVMIGADVCRRDWPRALRLGAVGLTATGCVGAWVLWQYLYFGSTEFSRISDKMGVLARATSGFDPRTALENLRFAFGPGGSYFLYFWGAPALFVGLWRVLRAGGRVPDGGLIVLLPVVALAYFVLLCSGWPQFLIAPAVLATVSVAVLWTDMLQHLASMSADRPRRTDLSAVTWLLCLTMFGYGMQYVIRHDVSSNSDSHAGVVAFLERSVPEGAVVETWERELQVLSTRTFHFPDQSFLAETNGALFRGRPRAGGLSADYFRSSRAAFLVVGSFGRTSGIYDAAFIRGHCRLLQRFGDGSSMFEVYAIEPPSASPAPSVVTRVPPPEST